MTSCSTIFIPPQVFKSSEHTDSPDHQPISVELERQSDLIGVHKERYNKIINDLQESLENRISKLGETLVHSDTSPVVSTPYSELEPVDSETLPIEVIESVLKSYEESKVVTQERLVEVPVDKKTKTVRVGGVNKWIFETLLISPVKSIFRILHNVIWNAISYFVGLFKFLMISVVATAILYVLISNLSHSELSSLDLARESYSLIKEVVETASSDISTFLRG